MRLKNFVNQFLTKYFNLTIERNTDSIFRNIYKSTFKKKVLLSYLTDPFNKSLTLSHTNYKENLIAATIFNELEYQVDVIHYKNDSKTIKYNVYDCLFGFGFPIENYFYGNTSDMTVLNFLTGCSTKYSNAQSIIQLKEIKETFNIWAADDFRISQNSWPLQQSLSDSLIVLGNDFSNSTYIHDQIVSLNLFFIKVLEIDLSSKKINKNLLWFGSTGVMHKGLHHAIEAIESQDDFQLHICGPIMKNSSFESIYKERISQNENIHLHGFVDITGNKFKELMNTCTYVLFPSLSEAGAASVLNCVGNGGLIPIIPKSVSLDLEGNEIILNGLNSAEITKALKEIANLDDQSIRRRSKQLYKFVNSVHSEDNFMKHLKEIIKTACNEV